MHSAKTQIILSLIVPETVELQLPSECTSRFGQCTVALVGGDSDVYCLSLLLLPLYIAVLCLLLVLFCVEPYLVLQSFR